MEVLVAALVFSIGMTTEAVPKFPKISSLLRLQLPCLKYDIVKSNLKYAGEHLRLSGITTNGEILMEVWVDSKGENWTVVLHTFIDSEGCIMATGKGVVEEPFSTTIDQKAGP